ncbi:2-methylcitrate dehydratase [Malassezia cuniculi]|uniref:2-methylcitrate dehydratase n=1 Tax=Malassezia cuniculi TaxID=948313 RepID=A0AAF0J7S4_9BASI|nr:2-methylcitrate dehydratase [Malassezia cuniculi]
MSGIGKGELNVRPAPDGVMKDIADYVHDYKIESSAAYATARLCLLDSLGCAIEALRFPAARRLCGPVVPGTIVPNGATVPGTAYVLDPIRAAFNIGLLVRWLDFNDTWLAAEWGHPSDNLGAILAVADWASRERIANGEEPLTVHDVLTAAIKAHEIQGVLALENSFNRVGLDHVVLVKVASTAVVSHMLGLTREQTIDAISHAFVDGQSLRTYRHAPNAGSRKSWAAGDACARAVNIALLVRAGEGGYNSVLTAPTWGFYDVLFKGNEFAISRPYGSYVMENVLFKLVPAEFHAQTAVEGAIAINKRIQDAGRSTADISAVRIATQEAAVRIISKQGALNNYADRDHCLQYMVAVALLKGSLGPDDYTDDAAAADPRIDHIRSLTTVSEEPRYTAEYLEADKRSIGNTVEVDLSDGTTYAEAIDYPVGHARRRAEAQPLIAAKLERHLAGQYDDATVQKLVGLLTDHEGLTSLAVPAFMDVRIC